MDDLEWSYLGLLLHASWVQVLDGTHTLDDPVSKMIWNSWGGEPTLMGPYHCALAKSLMTTCGQPRAAEAVGRGVALCVSFNLKNQLQLQAHDSFNEAQKSCREQQGVRNTEHNAPPRAQPRPGAKGSHAV